MFDLEAAEQRCVVAVALHPRCELGHHVAHELLSLFVNVIGVDQDVADVIVEVVANGANHQRRFLVNQECAFAAFGGAVNGGPQLQEVIQVPLQLGCGAANAGRARNDGHALGVFQLVHGFFELGPVVTLDAAADATAAGVIGHQHDVAAGQRDEGGQGGALVATLFFFDLNQELLAFADHIVDARLADRYAFGKVLARDLFEWQKAMAVFAVVDKASFKRGLDPGHNGFVNIAFALFATFDFDFVVEEFLSVDDGQAAFFSLRSVDEHPFHDAVLFQMPRTAKSTDFLVALACHRPTKGTRCRRRRLKRKELPKCPLLS